MRNKVLTLVVLGFALFFVITSPVEAADLVSDTIDAARGFLGEAADSFATFIRSLT